MFPLDGEETSPSMQSQGTQSEIGEEKTFWSSFPQAFRPLYPPTLYPPRVLGEVSIGAMEVKFF